MSIHNKSKQFSEDAKRLERELFDEQGNLRPEPLTNPEPEPTPDPEPTPEPAPEPTSGPEPEPEPTPVPEPKVDEDKKYKDAVKAMNEAQREAAELRKAQKEQADRQAELEQRLNEILKAKEKEKELPKPIEPEDDLEQDLPEVTKIAERKARKVQAELEARIAEIDKRLAAEEKIQKQKADEQAGLMIVQEVMKAHPDYQEVANSEGLKNWIEAEDTPPLFKAVYEGKVPATARDIVEVINRYKSSLVPAKITPDKPSDKVPTVKSTPNPTTKPNKPAPLTPAEIKQYQGNVHRMSAKDKEAFNARIKAMFET